MQISDATMLNLDYPITGCIDLYNGPSARWTRLALGASPGEWDALPKSDKERLIYVAATESGSLDIDTFERALIRSVRALSISPSEGSKT